MGFQICTIRREEYLNGSALQALLIVPIGGCLCVFLPLSPGLHDAVMRLCWVDNHVLASEICLRHQSPPKSGQLLPVTISLTLFGSKSRTWTTARRTSMKRSGTRSIAVHECWKRSRHKACLSLQSFLSAKVFGGRCKHEGFVRILQSNLMICKRSLCGFRTA